MFFKCFCSSSSTVMCTVLDPFWICNKICTDRPFAQTVFAPRTGLEQPNLASFVPAPGAKLWIHNQGPDLICYLIFVTVFFSLHRTCM